MTKKLLFVMTILLVGTLALSAADVSGKWVYEQPGRGGGNPVQVTLSLKAEGSKLTGTVSRPGRNGNMESEITDGKVSGNDISFKTTMQFGGNSMTSEYSGTLSGDELKLKVTSPGRDGNMMTREFTAKRSTT
jgi:hypothetical protein